MKLDLNLRNYVEWNVEGVIKIKKKYGYRVILKYPDGSKKEQQKSGFETHKEALAARDRTIGELAAGTYVVYENVSVKDFFGFWLEEDIHKRVGSHETYSSYEGIIRNHMVPYIGRKKMNELNRGDIQRLYNDRTEYSVSVARNVKVVVNTALKYAVVHRILSENPAEGVWLPKKAGKKKYQEHLLHDAVEKRF